MDIDRRQLILGILAAPLIRSTSNMQAPVPVLSVVTYPPGATKTQARLVIDGVRGAIFEYANGGPVGALVSSWARTAGTDPYGNAYPAGFNAGGGSSFSGTDFLINSSGAFFYSASPALGDLIASLAGTAGTDSKGNSYEAGINSYVDIGGIIYAVGLNQVGSNALVPGFSVEDITNPPFNPGGAFALTSNGAVKQAMAILASGQVTNLDLSVQMAVFSQIASGIVNGEAILEAGLIELGVNDTMVINDNAGAVEFKYAQSAGPAAIPGTFQLWGNSDATPSVTLPSSLTGTIPLAQSDISTHSAGNVATAADITKSWSIPATDGAAGTTYKIETRVGIMIGQTTAETLTLGADINGTFVPLATLGAAFNGSALSTPYDIPVELILVVDAAGTNTPEVYITGPLGQSNANRLSPNSANMSGHSTTATWNKANANTLALYAQWGGAGGSVQVATTISSRLYRIGP